MLTKIYDRLINSKGGIYLAVILVVFASVRWFYYINAYTVNLLFWDNWGFYEASFNHYNFINTFLYQHGPHRQGIGFVLTQFLDELSNWNSRYIGFAIGVFLFFTALIFTRIKYQLSGKLNFFDAIIFILVLTPAQFALFTNTPNISHGAMPAFLLALMCWAVLHKNFYVRGILILVLNFNLIYSGFGIFVGLLTPFIFLFDVRKYFIEKDAKKAFFSLAILLLTLLSFASFFVNYNWGHASSVSKTWAAQPWEYLYFVAIAYVNFVIANTSIPFLGLLVVLPLMVVFCMHAIKLFRFKTQNQKDYNQSLLIFILIGYSTLFISATAFGRIGFGLDGAHASRYIVYLVPSLFGMYLHFCQLPLKQQKPLVVVFFIVVSATTVPRKEMYRIATKKKIWADTYLQTNSIESANQRSGLIILPVERNAELQEKLDYLEARNLNLFNK